jgi:hypothetical protein
MADYLVGGGRDAEVAAALYSLAFEATAISFTFLFEWTLRDDGRLHEPLPPDRRWVARYRFYVGQAMYIAAIGVSFALPAAALVMSAVTAVYYMTPVPHLPGRQQPPSGGTRQDRRQLGHPRERDGSEWRREWKSCRSTRGCCAFTG